MADTDFSTLSSTNTLAAGDQLLVVRAGVAYRFSGVLPAVDSSGNLAVVKSGGSVGASGGLHLRVDGSSPTLNRLTFGTDGSGYRLAIGKNQGGTVTDYVVVRDDGKVTPGSDNAQTLGFSAFRWSVVYAGTGTINTSDEREKQQIDIVPDEWLDAWGDVEWLRFKFDDAVDAKGLGARWHLGMVAQQVRDAFAARDLDATTIGLLCFDEWEADGDHEAGDRWGLRYEECFAMEAAYKRRRMAAIEARLDALEP